MRTMPFGAHKGKPLSALPDDYLTWLATIAKQPLLGAVREEIRRRTGGSSGGTRTIRCPAPDVALELVGAGLKRLAHKHHPDLGGEHDAMIQVTAAADWLRERIKEAA